MGGIASRSQLRWSFWRWAIFTVPLVLLIGFASGRSVPAGKDNVWYAALTKPALNPPDWVFPVAWATLYVLLGLAIAVVLNARGARLRRPAAAMFAVELVALTAWQPLFFGAHRIVAAFWLVVFILIWGIATTVVFSRVRRSAAWLVVPFLCWVGFAAVLNWSIHRLNPAAELAPGEHTTQML